MRIHFPRFHSNLGHVFKKGSLALLLLTCSFQFVFADSEFISLESPFDTFFISNLSDELDIPSGAIYHYDTDEDIPLSEILNYFPQFKTPSKDFTTHFDYYRWLYLTIKNNTDQKIEYYWNAKVDKVELWMYYQKGEQYHKTGNMIPLSEKSIPLRNSFWTSLIPLELEPNQTVEIIGKAENITKSSTYQTSWKIQDQNSVERQLRNQFLGVSARNGFYIAFILCGLIVSLTYFLITRHKFAIYLAAICLFSSLLLLCINDYLYPLFPEHPVVRYWTFILFGGCTHVSIYLFFKNYLELNSSFPTWAKFYQYYFSFLIIITVVLIVYTIYTLEYGRALVFINAHNIVTYTIGIVFCFVLFKNKSYRNVTFGIASLAGSIVGLFSIYATFHYPKPTLYVIIEFQLFGFIGILSLGLFLKAWKNYLTQHNDLQLIKDELKIGPSQEHESPKSQFEVIDHIIETNLRNPQFSIESLAEEVGVSSRTIGRVVRKETDLSTINWIISKRMKKAQFLLEQNLCESPQEVAQNIGYSNYSYFVKVYLEHVGKTPQEYFSSK